MADTVKKPPPITGDQAVKFANYFLSRRSVQTAKGAYSLLEVVNTLTNNKVLSVLCGRIYYSLICCSYSRKELLLEPEFSNRYYHAADVYMT